MLFSLTQTHASQVTDVNEGFNVRVQLIAAPQNPANNSCSISNLTQFNSSQLLVNCTAAQLIASRYYKTPVSNWLNATQTSGLLPNTRSGVGLGTTSSLRVSHDPDDALIEVWVTW